ncbi:hypothetical protein QK292_10110 [Arthrobacter sp. AL08]|uniref:hypothetical protein n=1 Tax=Micrococcaceae TaxID=1268 RepID=UPI001CFF76A1|nr:MULTISPECIES: hypothetical protein [Micrococcaceae]MDI3241748.1 hypothetical protein [Arthrobacter sp. AL05]MDI3277928.1 hypothetical protein [Arthrobacter sp. AL08]MDJ0351698.1 hypothetical protein [Pseudarthrobacter sp. PH31-O2]WGZ81165.1 hypothetical protein QI450_08405 [Arthrobacter sp. EM1]
MRIPFSTDVPARLGKSLAAPCRAAILSVESLDSCAEPRRPQVQFDAGSNTACTVGTLV